MSNDDRVYRGHLILFTLIVFYLIVAFQYSPTKLINYLIGFVFTFIFVLTFILSSTVKINFKELHRFFDLCIKFMVLSSLPSLIGYVLVQDHLVNHPGIFREAGAFGSFMNVAVIFSLTLTLVTKNKKYLKYALYFTFLIFLTVLKKSMVASICVWALFIFYNNKYSVLKIKTTLIIILISVMLIFNFGRIAVNINKNLSYLNAVGSEGHVRIAMYIASFKIASDYFPFGSGLGTFGSFASILGDYKFPSTVKYQFNDIYYKYEVANLAGNSELRASEGGLTHLDTYWPHIIAELGFIAAGIFFILWLLPVYYSLRYLKVYHFIKDGHYFFMFYNISIIISMMLEGFTLIQPEVPLFIIFHAGVVGLALSAFKNNQNRKELWRNNRATLFTHISDNNYI